MYVLHVVCAIRRKYMVTMIPQNKVCRFSRMLIGLSGNPQHAPWNYTAIGDRISLADSLGTAATRRAFERVSSFVSFRPSTLASLEYYRYVARTCTLYSFCYRYVNVGLHVRGEITRLPRRPLHTCTWPYVDLATYSSTSITCSASTGTS